MKQCVKCGEVKPLDAFCLAKTEKDGRRYDCRACSNAAERRRRAADPEKQRESRRRWRENNRHRLPAAERRRTILRHGITPEDYAKLLDGQGGVCAACGADTSGGRYGNWHIDHDHSCCPGIHSCGNCIRGLLCATCNAALGLAGDNKERLLLLIAYLDRHAVAR